MHRMTVNTTTQASVYHTCVTPLICQARIPGPQTVTTNSFWVLARMSLVGFTFGSFGDIITTIGLAVQVRKALSESAGSSEEYHNLLADLDSFSHLLHTVQSVHLFSSSGPDKALTSLVNAIRYALDCSKVLLGEIYAKIAGY